MLQIYESSAAGVSLEGRLEEAELARRGFEGASVFGCVSDGSRMMLTFSVLKTGPSRRFLVFGCSSFELLGFESSALESPWRGGWSRQSWPGVASRESWFSDVSRMALG